MALSSSVAADHHRDRLPDHALRDVRSRLAAIADPGATKAFRVDSSPENLSRTFRTLELIS
jgi:hypothetical protein